MPDISCGSLRQHVKPEIVGLKYLETFRMISSEVVVILRKMMLRPLVLFLLFFSLLNAHLLRKAFAAVALTTEVAALAAFAIEAEVTTLKGRKSSTTLSLGHTMCGSKNKSGPLLGKEAHTLKIKIKSNKHLRVTQIKIAFF